MESQGRLASALHARVANSCLRALEILEYFEAVRHPPTIRDRLRIPPAETAQIVRYPRSGRGAARSAPERPSSFFERRDGRGGVFE